MENFTRLVTEQRNKNSYNLHKMTPLEIVTLMNNEDLNVITGVKAVLNEVATAIEWASESLKSGGRIIYMGAGTSGRLGLLDSVECPPTFGVSPETVIGLIAGGDNAFIKAVEGAEDSKEFGVNDLKKINLTNKDIVIGIAASGRTPYVIGGFEYAKSLGCKTVTIACNKNSTMSEYSDLAIEVDNGPEVLTGSSRLKSGTSQKMVLNMISTGTMVQLGKTYENLMVDVMQTNVKLVNRAERIIMEATGCDHATAAKARIESQGKVKIAIVMILFECTQEEAIVKLENASGHIRNITK